MALVPPFRQERVSQASEPAAQSRVVDNIQAQVQEIARQLNSSKAASPRVLDESLAHSWTVTIVGLGVSYPATPIARMPERRKLISAHVTVVSLLSSGTNYREFTLYRYRDGQQRGILAYGRTSSPGLSGNTPLNLQVGDDPMVDAGDTLSLAIPAVGAAAAVPAGTLSMSWEKVP